MAQAAHVRSRFLSDELEAYLAAHVTPPDALQRELRAETRDRAQGWAGMQIGDDQATLMEVLARAMGARRAVEVGTFTGYSALAVARGMGPEGRLLCCDVSEEWTAIARAAWEKAGVADRIELKLAPALETLRALPEQPDFDLAFIDADKTAYPDYYEELLKRIRPGGLILADNTLQSGRVLDAAETGDNVRVIRAFNDTLASDPRVQSVLLPIGDGLTVTQRL